MVGIWFYIEWDNIGTVQHMAVIANYWCQLNQGIYTLCVLIVGIISLLHYMFVGFMNLEWFPRFVLQFLQKVQTVLDLKTADELL